LIEGIGIDIVELSRFKRTIDDWDEQFLDKIFTPNELKYSKSKFRSVQHLAARFAVKEAVAKALSKGLTGGFSWKDVEVENDESGKPNVILHGHLKEVINNRNIFISISHSENVVVAVAVIEK